MSDTPEYMLKPGVTISDDILLWGPNMVAITVRDKQGIYQGSIGRELFERAFVPLDVQALEKQLDRLLLENGAQFHEDYEALRAVRPTKMSALEMKEKMEAESRKEFIEEVLALLFGLHNTEEQT